MKTHELVHAQRVPRDDRVRSFPRISVACLRDWFRELAAAGLVVELEPDDWELTPAGRTHFAGIGEIDLFARPAVSTSRGRDAQEVAA